MSWDWHVDPEAGLTLSMADARQLLEALRAGLPGES